MATDLGFAVILLGSVISLIGAFGLVRFPDVYTRSHAQTVLNVGGTCLILLGVFLQSPFLSLYSVKSLLIVAFIFLTSPVGTHAITRAAYRSGVKPKKLKEDELSYKIEAVEKPKPQPASKDYIKSKESGYTYRPKVSRLRLRLKARRKK